MQLYEPLLERDIAGIRAAVGEFRKSHSSHQLFEAIARFAVLAYAPSQHAKHAVLACRSAYELGEPSDELLAECAIYAASSRQPWSEPPITDPPAIEADQRGDIEELREAVGAGDRLRAERWLAARLDDPHEIFTVAADDFEDLGHKLIVATTAWKLASLFGQQGRFATLRIAVWEMTSYHGERYQERGNALDSETLLDRLIANMDVVSAHQVFLLDAALQTEDEAVIRRVRDYLSFSGGPPSLAPPAAEGRGAPLSYSLARDYGGLLKAHAVAKRLGPRFPGIDFDRMIAAAAYNLEHAPSFEEYSFA
jgi:hypothetical protein